jgi:mRNA-degrading endonuclease toxin of MazEF toxin-antitoxin module
MPRLRASASSVSSEARLAATVVRRMSVLATGFMNHDSNMKKSMVTLPPTRMATERNHSALPENVRSISRKRLARRRGGVGEDTLGRVLRRVHLLTRPPR